MLPCFRRHGLLLGTVHPSDHLKCSIVVLGNRSAAFHPVTRVDVVNAVHITVRGVVNMTTNDAIDALPARLVGQGLFETSDKADRVLDLQLGPGGQ